MSADLTTPVSVVVPTRGRRGMLGRTVEAIVTQDLASEIECIVVHDDHSTDIPPDAEVDDGRVRIRHIPNARARGLAGARNTGILAARHPRIAFCDDDDTWYRCKLRLQSELLSRPAVKVVGCANTVVYGQSRTLRGWPTDSVTLSDLIRSRVAVLHASTMLTTRDAILNEIGLVSEEIPGGACEDYEWTLRAAKVAPIAMVQTPLADILWHDESLFARRWDVMAAGLEFILDHHREFDDCRRGKARICGQIAFRYAAMGEGVAARRWAGRCVRLDPLQSRAYLAVLVSTGLISADRLVHHVQLRGRGI